ncbi:hypothetical protein GCK72_015655 [Caenorhabditis remanei]|uniref:DUF7591 domain-containing protein n=1 Tax=Caenorhabditis remanei TaxID=31234 RepID=A0A6A5GX32_CAERE|nr:hypothetical protein GCK72_015655 [Caenorhabditis remanei]KAF1759194.1 hypothetical protein GCK72_015655 [Caenorhabditis remanei]
MPTSTVTATSRADKNNSLNLPQQFLGPIKTYVLTGGVANITMSDISNVFEETNSLPRHGFISSNQYGSYSTSQGSRSEITSPNLQRIKYSYSIQNVDFSGNATLKVIGYLNRSLAFSKSYNHSSSLAQEQFYGDTLYVDFRTESLPNTGFYLSFEMENANGSSKFCVFSVLLMVFVGCFF